MKSLWKQEDLVPRITVATGIIADMPGIFERAQNQCSDDVLRTIVFKKNGPTRAGYK